MDRGIWASLANNSSLFSVYSHDIGQPIPAAMAFGLAGGWVTSLFIRLGLHPVDAYTSMNALWLLVSLVSAYLLARKMNATRVIALLCALLWLSSPMVWGHMNGYAMVALGMGLLPVYFFCALNVFFPVQENARQIVFNAIFYAFSAVVSVFMDGYSFVMFAIGSGMLLMYAIVFYKDKRRYLLKIALPVHMACFALAYLLYAMYIGRGNFDPHPIDIFRAYGVDLSFIAIPTKGMHWVMDMLGLSVPRSTQTYFGDESVWSTTFSLPIVIAGLLSWWFVRKQKKLETGILVTALFGFYMALGPSIKVNSTISQAFIQSEEHSYLMPAKEASVRKTGNAWISKHIPGFNVMRASYRWSTLEIFALWLLVSICAGQYSKRRTVVPLMLAALIVLNLPHLPKKWQANTAIRETVFRIDRELVDELKKEIQPNELIAFVPWTNDYMANYIVPCLKARSYNIGGDKNLYAAQKYWPSDLLALGYNLRANSANAISKLILSNEIDHVIIPYYDMLRAPLFWPCAKSGGVDCPTDRQQWWQPVIDELKAMPYLEVKQYDLFTAVHLQDTFKAKESSKSIILSQIYSSITYPIHFNLNTKNAVYLLAKNWYALEEEGVWSQEEAELDIPIPPYCVHSKCQISIKYAAYCPTLNCSVTFQTRDSQMYSVKENHNIWRETFFVTSNDLFEVSLPAVNFGEVQRVMISVQNAVSPQQATGYSTDKRILGINLKSIEIKEL